MALCIMHSHAGSIHPGSRVRDATRIWVKRREPGQLRRHHLMALSIMNSHAGSTLADAIRIWLRRREPVQLRRLIVALIRFVMFEGRGIRSLDAVTVQGESVVNVVESGLVQVASSDCESEQVSDNCMYVLENLCEDKSRQSNLCVNADFLPLGIFRH